jgi:hypothetical protein
VDPKNYKYEDLAEFVPPPIGKMTFHDFNILYHIKVNEKQGENEGEVLDEVIIIINKKNLQIGVERIKHIPKNNNSQFIRTVAAAEAFSRAVFPRFDYADIGRAELPAVFRTVVSAR